MDTDISIVQAKKTRMEVLSQFFSLGGPNHVHIAQADSIDQTQRYDRVDSIKSVLQGRTEKVKGRVPAYVHRHAFGLYDNATSSFLVLELEARDGEDFRRRSWADADVPHLPFCEPRELLPKFILYSRNVFWDRLNRRKPDLGNDVHQWGLS